MIADAAFDCSIVDRFNVMVRAFPTRLAIQDMRQTVTYAELAASVERIAEAVAAATQGVPGPVALLVPANVNAPAAMLGVLAARRPYIALDPGFPAEHNASIVADTGVCAMIAGAEYAGDAATVFRNIPVIAIEDWPRVAQAAPRVPPAPDDLAAIYTTSGSSGRPKSVAWNHRNILHWVGSFTAAARITCADRLVLLMSPAVSASYRPVYCALLNGASVHMVSPRELGVTALIEEIRARRISIFHSVPTPVRRIAESLGAGERLDSVRIVHMGGDRVRWSDVDLCRQLFSPDVKVHLSLSSTETGPCIDWTVDDAVRDTAVHPPLGRPADGWTVTIVDDDGRPAPDGEVGSIVATGRFVALGHWQGSDMRVAPFPPDPSDPDGRVYATGDRARRRCDGLIEFVGRKDQRIKLHGFRIEIGEVEVALGRLPGVEDAAVVVRNDGSGAPRSMVAYVEPGAGAGRLRPQDVRSMLTKFLPPYMIPATIKVIDRMPRLSMAKIDRTRLAEIDAESLAQAIDPADEPLIAEVIDIFHAMLGQVGATPEDNFFSLGGDSLQVVRVALELEKRFGIFVSPDTFVTTQTIRELARWLAVRNASPAPNVAAH